MGDSQHCGGCRFYFGDETGHCRRFPPLDMYGARPSVSAEYWCGEFEPATTGDPPLTHAMAEFVQTWDLPDDIAEALESFKLGIMRHRLAGWMEVSQSQIKACLEFLRDVADEATP